MQCHCYTYLDLEIHSTRPALTVLLVLRPAWRQQDKLLMRRHFALPSCGQERTVSVNSLTNEAAAL